MSHIRNKMEHGIVSLQFLTEVLIKSFRVQLWDRDVAISVHDQGGQSRETILLYIVMGIDVAALILRHLRDILSHPE